MPGESYTKSLNEGLFEIRARGKEGIERSCFCTLVAQGVGVLRFFIKKSQKMPKKEMKIVRKRLKEVKN